MTRERYILRYCPRYVGDDADKDRAENLGLQKSFWNAINFILIREPGAKVELQFRAVPGDRSIRVTLDLFHHSPAYANAIDRLLPANYEWLKRVNTPTAADHDESWSRVALVRRLEYFNLPTGYPWFLRTGSDAAAGLHDEPDSGFTSSHERQLPTIGLPIRTQLKARPLCIPLLGNLSEEDIDRRQLCVELQAAAPATVTLVIQSVRPSELDQDRVIATYLRRCLEPHAFHLSGSGYAPYFDLYRNYDRYWLPPDYLCRMGIRVAAPDRFRLLAVAQAFAAEFGGMRAFELLSVGPSGKRQVPPTGNDRVREKDGFSGRAPKIITFEGMRRQNVIDDPMYRDFLLRMPNLYTIDEAQCLLRLPVAGERGLPGIDARLVPPFYLCRNHFASGQGGESIVLGRIPMERSKIESSDGDASAVSDVNGSDFFTVPMSQLTKHLLIVGTPGSGKTTAVCNIVNEISRCHVPFLVVESTKREYYNVLKRHLPNVRRLCFDGTLDGTPHRDYFTFDPMRLTHGASVSRHISFLKACFQAAMPLNDVMALILENGMFEYYTRHRSKGGCGLGILQHGGVHTHFVDSRTGHVVPSFEHFRAFFIEHYLEDDLKLHSLAGRGLNTEFVEMTRNAFRRRFELLLSGPIGVSMRRADCQFRIALERLLRSPSKAAAKRLAGAYNPLIPVWWSQAVVELDGLPDNSDKALLMAFLLTFLFEYRQSQFALAASSQSGSVALRHLFVLEEAHRILGRGHISQSRGIDTVGMNSLQTAQMLFENLLAEIRAMGQGIAVVEQIPSKIMPEVVKNTNLRLMLRLSEKEDRDYLGEAMNFTEAQKRFVATLTAGRGVVFEEGLDEPVLIELPRAPRTAQRESAED